MMLSWLKRFVSIGIASSAAVAAVAQKADFYIAYGDQAWATANNANVGDRVSTATPSSVAGLNSIRVKVMAKISENSSHAAGGVMLCFDSANTGATSKYTDLAAFQAATVHKVLSPSGIVKGTDFFLPTGLPGKDNSGNDITVDASELGNMALSGSGGAGVSVRPAGFWGAFSYGLGKSVYTPANQPVPIADFVLNINQAILLLNYSGRFGYNDEPGLMLFGSSDASSRKTYLGAVTGEYQAVLSKVIIQSFSAGDLPDTEPDSYNATEDTTLNVDAANGVLVNDLVAHAGDTLTVKLSRAPLHGTVTLNANGSFTYVPFAEYNGSDNFGYQALDQNGVPSLIETCTINVAPVNDPPTVDLASQPSTNELAPATVQLIIADPKDNPANAPYVTTIESGPPGLTVGSSTGVLSWTPTEEQGPGTYDFTVRVTDSGTGNNSTVKSFKWTVKEVNVAPTLDAMTPVFIPQGATATVTATGHDADLPAQTLTYGLATSDAPAATINPSTGVFTWNVPADATFKKYFFTITVTDPDGQIASQILTVTVVPSGPLAPELDPIGPKFATINSQLAFTLHATDANGDAVEYLMQNAPAGATLDPQTGQFKWTPGIADVGSVQVTFIAKELTAQQLSDSEVVTITVSPSSNKVDFYLAYGDASWAALNGAAVGQAIDTSKPCHVQGLAQVRVRVMVLGNVESQHGAGGIMLCFDSGLANATSSFSGVDTFNLATTQKVLSVSGLAANVNYFLAQGLPGKTNAGADTTVDVSILGNMALSGSAGVGTTTRPLGLWAPFSFGLAKTLYLAAGNSVPLVDYVLNIDHARLLTTYGGVYGAKPEESGITLFAQKDALNRSTYLGVTYGEYQAVTSKVILASVSGGNSPTANADAYSVDEDKSLSVPVASGLLANDSDPDLGDKLYAAKLTNPAHGTVAVQPDGSFTYVPAADFNGADSFTYKAVDTFGNSSAPATCSITVTSVNDPPVIQNYAGGALDEMVPKTYQFVTSDPKDNPANTPILVTMIEGPTGMTISSDGLMAWTPTEDQGPKLHPVKVQVTDSLGASSTLEFMIQVNEVNRAPELQDFPVITAQQSDVVNVTAVGTDPDLPAQNLTYSLVGNVGTAKINATTGEFQWAIPANQPQGEKQFSVRVTDTYGLFAEKILKVIVGDAEDDPPVLDPIGPKNGRVKELLKFKLKATDAEADPLVFSMSPLIPGATLDPQTGQFSWRPDTTQEGEFDIVFKVTEQTGAALHDEEIVHFVIGPARSKIGGYVQLRDFVGDITKEPIRVEVRTPLGALVEAQDGVELGRLGQFEFYTIQTGKFMVVVKGKTWLSQVRYPMTLSLTDPMLTSFHLINGDCNGDNVVNALDLAIIDSAFGTKVGDAAYDRRADLNMDGKVNATDKAICTKNQKLMGY